MSASGQQDATMEKASQPTLCANGCGFYSNAGTAGLCSKCFREQQLQTDKALELSKAASSLPPAQPVPAAAEQPEAPSPSTSAAAAAAAPAPAPDVAPLVAPASDLAATASPAPAKPSPTRCLACNKKVGLTGFTCKCQPDAVFCSTHRYAEAHSCSFDWKATQRAALAANNPVVQASKLQRL